MLLLVRVQPAMKCPEQMQLSQADGEALRARLAGDALTADDRRVLDQVLQWYFSHSTELCGGACHRSAKAA
jgi:hypothetical protein